MSGAPEPVRIELEWARPLMLEVSRLNMNTSALPDGRRAKLMLVVLLCGVASLMVLLFFGPFTDRTATALIGIGLGIMIMRLIVSMIHIPAMAMRRVDRLLASPFYQGATTLTLSSRGIASEQTRTRSHYDWAVVTRLQDGDLALHVMVAETVSIPIPDLALPAEINRAELRRRIEEWRVAA